MKKYLITLLATLLPAIFITQIVKTESIKTSQNQEVINNYQLDLDNSSEYHNSFTTMFATMIKNQDLLSSNLQDTNKKNELFKVANRNNSNKYLIIQEKYQQKVIDLIIETNYWYIDGFVPLKNDNSELTYYHFTKGKVLSLPWVKNNVDINYNGDYYSLAGKNNDVEISKNEIQSAFVNLYNTKTAQDFKLLKLSLVTKVFQTSEALRFFTVRESVEEVLNSSTKFSWRNTCLYNVLQKWGLMNREYYASHVDDAKNEISTLNLLRKK